MDDISVNCEEKFQQKEENKGQNIENWLQEEDHDDCPPNSKSAEEDNFQDCNSTNIQHITASSELHFPNKDTVVNNDDADNTSAGDVDESIVTSQNVDAIAEYDLPLQKDGSPVMMLSSLHEKIKELELNSQSNHKIIDTEEDEMDLLIKLGGSQIFGLKFVSSCLGRGEKLRIMVVSFEDDSIDILDVNKLGISNGMKTILECESIQKLMFDCRSTADCFYHQYNVNLSGIVDLQLVQYILLHPERPAAEKLPLFIELVDMHICSTTAKSLHTLTDSKHWDERHIDEKIIHDITKETRLYFILQQKISIVIDDIIPLSATYAQSRIEFQNFDYDNPSLNHNLMPLGILGEVNKGPFTCVNCGIKLQISEFDKKQFQQGKPKCIVCQKVTQQHEITNNKNMQLNTHRDQDQLTDQSGRSNVLVRVESKMYSKKENIKTTTEKGGKNISPRDDYNKNDNRHDQDPSTQKVMYKRGYVQNYKYIRHKENKETSSDEQRNLKTKIDKERKEASNQAKTKENQNLQTISISNVCNNFQPEILDFSNHEKEAISRLQTLKICALRCESKQNGRYKEMSEILICLKDDTWKTSKVFIVDLKQSRRLPQDLIPLLQDNEIKKLMFDCRNCADHLLHEYKVHLSGIIDLQLIQYILDNPTGKAGQPLPSFVKTISNKFDPAIRKGLLPPKKKYPSQQKPNPIKYSLKCVTLYHELYGKFSSAPHIGNIENISKNYADSRTKNQNYDPKDPYSSHRFMPHSVLNEPKRGQVQCSKCNISLQESEYHPDEIQKNCPECVVCRNVTIDLQAKGAAHNYAH